MKTIIKLLAFCFVALSGNAQLYRPVFGPLNFGSASSGTSSNIWPTNMVAADVRIYGAKGDGVTDDTTAIQNAINSSYTHIKLSGSTTSPSRYMITGLTVPNSKFIEADPNVQIFLINGANTYMLRNSDWVNGNTNIVVKGGVWIGNGANQTQGAWKGHVINFRYATNIAFEGLQMTNDAVSGAFTLRFNACSGVSVKDISFNVLKDGIHINGPGSRFYIENIRGYTGDDLIALLAGDYPDYEETKGNITDVVINGVYPQNAYSVGRVVGGNGYGITNVTFNQVYGSISGPIGFNMQEELTAPNLITNLLADNITFRDISITMPSGSLFNFTGNQIGHVTIDGLYSKSLVDRQIYIGSNVVELVINNANVDNGVAQWFIEAGAGANVRNLRMANGSVMRGNGVTLFPEGSVIQNMSVSGFVYRDLNLAHQFYADTKATFTDIYVTNTPSFLYLLGSHTSRFAVNNFISGGGLSFPVNIGNVLHLVSVTSNSKDFFADIATLTPLAGDQVYNSNAASGAVGFQIRDATIAEWRGMWNIWKNYNSVGMSAIGIAGQSLQYFSGTDSAFNRNVNTGAIDVNTGYAYQWHRTPDPVGVNDKLSLQIYDTTGATITTDAIVVNGSANVGIGTPSPGARFDVMSKFLVDVNGNITKLNNLAYSFPAARGPAGSVLTDAAADGTLTWAAASGGVALSAITAAAADNAIQNGAFNQLWTFTDPGTGEINFEIAGTNSTASRLLHVRGKMTHANAVQTEFGETFASTGGSGGQDVVRIGTVAASTATPVSFYQRGARILEVGYNAPQLWAATESVANTPFYSFVGLKTGGMKWDGSSIYIQNNDSDYISVSSSTIRLVCDGQLDVASTGVDLYNGGRSVVVLNSGDASRLGIEYISRVATDSSGTVTLTTGVAGNTATGSGSIHNCTGTVTYAFPASPQIGDTYTVLVNSGNTVTLDPAGASQVLRIGASITTANTGTATCSTQGSFITFVYVSSNVWYATSWSANWSTT